MPERGEIISGKYRILERLGSGAMGIVYSALHLDTDKQVALKWLSPAMSNVPDGQERFKREAKATGRIHHPNVVAVHDCGEHEGQLYLVMEYLAGPTLRARLTAADDKRLALPAALELLFPVMRGIAAAHAAGVLHRDLKPENVLLSESPDGLAPIPKVLDFGLAKVRSEAASFAAKLSMPGSVLGTYQYMAPEQLRPQVELDERIDVYALGAMLYEMLSGQPPYCADNPVDLVLQIHAGEVPHLGSLVPDVPPELSGVLAQALARDREQRFVSVDALAVALEPFTNLAFRGGNRAASERSAADTIIASVRAISSTVPVSRPARQQTGLRAGLCLLALFAQPAHELAVAKNSVVPAAQELEAPFDMVVPGYPSAQPAEPSLPNQASDEEWPDESGTVVSQPTAAVPASAHPAPPPPPPPAAAHAAERRPTPRVGVRAAPSPPEVSMPARNTVAPKPSPRPGPGSLSTNEF